MTSFIANLVRDEHKHPEPFTSKDFMVDWNELWNAVGEQPATELTDEEELVRTELLAGKVLALNTWFGGTSAK